MNTNRFHALRRATLSGAAALAAWGALPALAQSSAKLPPTPGDAEGPFYPTRIPADADSDLTRISGRAVTARGSLLYLQGRVLGTDAAPLGGTRIELWQCDALGRYHHVDGDPGERDENFQGYGVATTDAAGRYAFRTIRPVRYGSRPPHLHFKLAHARARTLTTQLYPRGESAERSAGSGLSDRGTRTRLEIALAPAEGREAGAVAASFDFVLASA